MPTTQETLDRIDRDMAILRRKYIEAMEAEDAATMEDIGDRLYEYAQAREHFRGDSYDA